MKKLTTLLFIIFGVTNIYGQTELPPDYSISPDLRDGYFYLPDSCWQIMTDTTGKMTLQEAVTSHAFQNKNRKINYHYKTYWIRFRLVNKSDKEINVYPSFNQDAQKAELYIKADSTSWQHYRNGTLIPWNKRDGLKSLIAVQLAIPPGKTLIIYEKLTFDYSISEPTRAMVYFYFIRGIDLLQQTHYTQSLWSVFLLGIILLAVIINLYFYIIVREKEFLYFSLLTFFLGLNFIAGVFPEIGYLGDVFFKNHPYIQYYLTFTSGTFQTFFFIYFIRHILKTFHGYRRWDKYLIVLSFASILISIFGGFAAAIFHRNLIAIMVFMFLVFSLITSLSLLITFLFYLKNKDKMIRIMLFALGPYVIFQIIIGTLAFPADISWLFTLPSNNPSQFMLLVWKLLDIFRMLGRISYIWMVALFACVLFMRFSQLRRRFAKEKLERERERRTLVEQQKIELEKQVTERTSELQESLENLKSTQKQLIQSEKMASLGELTAGIAHEIQNPLNFVNNFSDVNQELLSELKEEADKGNIEDVKAIADDVIANSEKINHHGKRADAIVKGMLQHSRTSTGQKELTDINALADEYLRLSYHGMRAKDKSFNATMKTDFDETLPKINVVPQDIGRLILNLINNAFYAVSERLQQVQPDIHYEPTVTVSTKFSPLSFGEGRGEVIIKVADNGNGIPEKIKDKIFQPFFTTKPTGEGTGLGLSLSYDIVKAHGGEIKVETTEGEGTEFIIQLPV